MANQPTTPARTIGLVPATGIGVGAIVGGGILVLAGVAYVSTGPAALVAFALNGLVAFITAMSYAEISTSFPESGGAYAFARKVLSVRAAFGVGWILWFAYIVAGVLYALGFGSYAALAIDSLLRAVGADPPAWLAGRSMLLVLAIGACITFALGLARKATGGGQWITVGKVVVFAFLIAAGAVVLAGRPVGDIRDALDPFFAGGATGLLAAMGFTFIALQGFEIIAAVAGEVRDPRRTLPRAMFLSLGIALVVYLPLLFVVATAGVEPGGSIVETSRAQPETVVAVAVGSYLGRLGYWLVVVAAILSTLSALQANLLAASRIAFSMARDRTLPTVLVGSHPTRGTPVVAILASSIALLAILFMVPNLAAAGAAASLIFLIVFTLAHLTTYLARSRGGSREDAYRTPWFPAIPIIGGVACAGLALFQAVRVPSAGSIMLLWLGLGIILYLSLFSRRAELSDASAEAADPDLVRLRGRNPLVLLPIANPAHAPGMVAVANALAPQRAGRVLLLSIVQVGEGTDIASIQAKLDDAQQVVKKALAVSYGFGHSPEALITAAAEPWAEIRRVAEEHGCASLLVGLGDLSKVSADQVEKLMNDVDVDAAVMRAPLIWRLETATRILVPIGGRGDQHELRARLLGAICREAPRNITFVTVVPERASDAAAAEAQREAARIADLGLPGKSQLTVIRADDPAEALITEAASHDLMVLGVRSTPLGRKRFGEVALRIASQAPCAVIMLGRRRYRAHELWQPLRDAMVEPVRRMKRPSWLPFDPEE